jgi:hypothetical protein
MAFITGIPALRHRKGGSRRPDSRLNNDRNNHIDGVITISAFSSWEDVFSDNMNLMNVPRLFCALEKPFVKLYLGIHYGFDTTNYSPLKALENFDNRPLLLMHSTKD